MGLMNEFKAFALRGNVVDMAVGIIIGAAFGKIVSAAIDDLIMPPIGKLLGNVDFSNLYVALSDKVAAGLALVEAKKLGPVFAYGHFIMVVIDFLILAFCIFMGVKAMNALKHKEASVPAAAPTTKECPMCASTIPIKAKRCPCCTTQLD